MNLGGNIADHEIKDFMLDAGENSDLQFEEKENDKSEPNLDKNTV